MVEASKASDVVVEDIMDEATPGQEEDLDLINPDDIEEEGKDEEIFSPQDMEGSEVQRLKERVATLEGLLAKQVSNDAASVVKALLDMQERAKAQQSSDIKEVLE